MFHLFLRMSIVKEEKRRQEGVEIQTACLEMRLEGERVYPSKGKRKAAREG